MTRLTQLSVVVMLCIAMPAFSQITFTGEDLPDIGDTLHYAIDNKIGLLGLGPGGTGNGQIWDFSGLTRRSGYDVRVLAPEQSPDRTLFPEATVVLELDTLLVYGRQTGEGLFALGTSLDVLNTGTPIPLRLDPAPKVLSFPTTLGTTYEQRYRFAAQLEGSALGLSVDSVRLIRNAYERVTTDAAGQLLTPEGAYESLRIYSITESIDSIFVRTLGNWVPVSADTILDRNYRWVTKGGYGTVLLFFLNDNGQPGRIEWVTDIDRGNQASRPEAQFSFREEDAGTVVFTDLSTNAPESWNWDFGDGSDGSNEQHPTHTFTQNGEYEVCLIAANAAGADTLCQTVAVTTLLLPVAQFGFQDQGGGVVAFTDLSTNAPDTWRWDFGDGATGADQSPTHTYAQGGAYEVCLIVTNATGADTLCQTVTVDFAQPPSAQFSFLDQGDGVVAFTDLSTNSPDSWNWSFGDGATGSEQNPAHSYEQDGAYEVCLIAANTAGADTLCQTVTVAKAQPPAAQFTFQDEGEGLVLFTDLSTNNPTAWSWDFGDGAGSAERNPQHNYAQSGRYTVCLIAANGAGADTACQNIDVRVTQAPVAQFTVVRKTGNTYAFTDKSTNSPSSWRWSFGDGNSSAEQNPTHTYSDGASYTVCLIATNGAGADTTCQVINGTGVQKPVAQFNYLDQGENTYAFTDLSTNNPTAWTWDFGDGSGSAEQNASHIYTASGNYSVCLAVANEAGADTVCQIIDVFVPVPPVAQFRIEDRGNATLAFTDLSTNQPILWMWEFGDGATSSTQHPTHTYEKAGTYKICLTVANGAGLNTSCRTAEVKKAVPPVAQFRFEKTGEKTVAFTDLSTNGPTAWNWNFGDGATSTDQNPTHSYQNGGEYTVCLITANSAGADTACQRIAITVQQPPAAQFSVQKQGNGVYAFTDRSTNSPTSWSWKFGDGASSTEQNPTHTYAQSGAYQVCLTATNTAGANTSCQTINASVVLRPVAGFRIDDRGNGAYNFTDQSTNAPSTWSWDFGDGNRSNQPNPSHTYAQSGAYQVCLIAANSAGADTSCQTINAVVVLAPTAQFTYQDQGNNTFAFTDRSTNSPASWNWGFGDGGTSTERNPVHTYFQEGEFRVCLTVTNSAGTNTTCQNLQVEQMQRPAAAFRFEDRGNRTIAFIDESANRPASWSWNFGDGNSSAEASPVHTYQADGAYSVCLTVSNSAGFNTNCMKVSIGVTSVEPLEQRYGFRLYPNPARDRLRIELDRLGGERLFLSFYTLSGQELSTTVLQADQTLDLSAWPEGVYLFTVKSAEGQVVGSGKVQVVK